MAPVLYERYRQGCLHNKSKQRGFGVSRASSRIIAKHIPVFRNIMADSRQDRFDNILFSLAQEHSGGALDLLDTFFSFFARKTDFFVGGEEGEARKILLEKFDRWSRESYKIKEKEVKERADAEKRRTERIAAKKKEEDERIKKMAQEEPTITEITDEEAMQIEEQKNKPKGLICSYTI